MSLRRPPLRTVVRSVAGVVVAAALVYGGFLAWNAWKVWRAWNAVPRVEFDIAQSRRSLPAAAGPDERLDEMFDAYLVVGNDAKPEAEGSRADAILLYLESTGDGSPVLLSIPRDLYVPSPCDGEPRRINANLDGCGDAVGGPALLALAVEDFTGIPIDHYAAFGFEGFTQIVDQLGGVEICVPNALRDSAGDLLPAGCTLADGATALAWLRSRTTFEQVDGEWRALPDDGDLARNVRQQQFLLLMLEKLNDFRSPSGLSRVVEGLSGAFVLDDQMSLGEAVGIAWGLRGLDPGQIARPILPVEPGVTEAGGFALVPAAAFSEVLAATHPDAAALLAERDG